MWPHYKAMSDIRYVYLTSADTTNPGVGTALSNAIFTNSFEFPLQFRDGQYEVALLSITAHLSTSFDPATAGSVFVYSDFSDGSVVLGSQQVNLLRRIYFDTVGRSEQTFEQLIYVPIGAKSFSRATVELRDATGTPIPIDANQGTTVTLAIRRKIYVV